MPGPVRDPGKIPGPVFIPNVAAIRLVWQLPNGKDASNILHCSFPAGTTWTQANADTLFGQVGAALTSSGLQPLLHAETLFKAVGIRDLTAIPGSSFGHGEFLGTGTAVPGTAPTGNALPSNVSFVVSLKTGLSRQANRGRVYIPGWAAAANDTGGHATTAAANAAQAFVNAIKTDLFGSTPVMVMCIAHPARQSYPSRNPAAPAIPARAAGSVAVVSVVYLDQNWDTQRLRNRV